MSVKVMTAVWEYGPSDSTQRFVLLAIADNARDNGSHAFPSVKELSEKCALSERTVIRALDALIKDGYLIRRRRKDTTNLYQVVLERLRPTTSVSANMTLTVNDNMTLTEVTDDHPRKCQDVTPIGDTVSPDPSINHHVNRQDQPSASAAPPPPAAAAAADPLSPILDWIEFDDTLTPKERATLTPPILLAWAYWVHLKHAERSSRIHNPVGLVRAQWRSGKQPRADLLALARGWLALDDDRRGRLLGRLEWVRDFAAFDSSDPIDDEFPNLPLSTAAAVYIATGGDLGPPSLSPPGGAIPPPSREPAAPRSPISPPSQTSTADSPNASLWADALIELEMQMTRDTFAEWLRGTRAEQTPNGLTVRVRNNYAVDWLSKRLHPVIQRTVDGLAGRPLPVTYVAISETKS